MEMFNHWGKKVILLINVFWMVKHEYIYRHTHTYIHDNNTYLDKGSVTCFRSKTFFVLLIINVVASFYEEWTVTPTTNKCISCIILCRPVSFTHCFCAAIWQLWYMQQRQQETQRYCCRVNEQSLQSNCCSGSGHLSLFPCDSVMVVGGGRLSGPGACVSLGDTPCEGAPASVMGKPAADSNFDVLTFSLTTVKNTS